MAAFASMGCVFLIGVAWLYHNDLAQFWKLKGAFFTSLSIACLLAAHIGLEQRDIAPGMVTRALMMLGVLAYGLYAWHGLLLKHFSIFEGQFLSTYFVSLALAVMSYLLIEKPAIALGKRTAAGAHG